MHGNPGRCPGLKYPTPSGSRQRPRLKAAQELRAKTSRRFPSLPRGRLMRRVPLLALLFVATLGFGLAADAPKPAAELPEVKELPNPFAFADGKPVRTKEDWTKRR